MRIARWVTKVMNAFSQYVKLKAYPLRQLLHGYPRVLRLRALHVLLYSAIWGNFECFLLKLFHFHFFLIVFMATSGLLKTKID